ncbi:MAG: HD domain-containing phosphohydrolase [Lachnospira sp.]
MVKDTVRKGIIVIIGIALNVLGRIISSALELPVWFDMLGTILASYYVGIWGGIIAGVFNNLISNFYDVTALVYTITSVLAACIMRFLIKKGYMNNWIRAVVSSFWLGVICTVVSTPLNLIFYDGYSGNKWGDTLVDMLKWHDVPDVLAALAGEAVVEIVDKQICVMVAYFVIYFIGRLKVKKSTIKQNVAMLLVAGVLSSLIIQPVYVKAEEELYVDNFVEKIYDNKNGMFSAEANAICETNDGYIWIGSYSGLTRYNGNEFEFASESGVVNVVCMMTDSKGRLWIGTNDAGVVRYEDGQYSYFTGDDGIPSNSVRCFAEDGDGNVYVGTSDKICKFDTNDVIDIPDYNVTFSQAMTVCGDLLFVVDNKGRLHAINYRSQEEIDNSVTQDSFFYCLGQTSKGLMAGTETGELFVIDILENAIYIKEQVDISANQISSVFEDSKKRIWVATESDFGYFDSGNTYHKMHYDGFDSSIKCFHEDYQGNIWVASNYYGVMKLSESAFVNMFEKAGIEKEYVNAVTYYDGDYYCGMNDGIKILDGEDLTVKTNSISESVQGLRVRSLYVDSTDRLWLCTYGGLFCYDKKDGISVYKYDSYDITSERFRCITQLSDGTIVTGTADGINFFKDGDLTGALDAQDGLVNTQILSIVEGLDGTVWAGSDGSGIYVISEGKLIENYTVEDGLSSNIILRIVPHEDGYFIVTSNALCHVDLDGTIRKLNSFPYFNNYDVIIDGETAYVTGSAGLYEVDLSKLCDDTSNQFMHYGAGEGLFSGLTANSWNYVSNDGSIYLCSNNGIIVFNKQVEDANTDMKYSIVSVECDGTALNSKDGRNYVVPSDAKNISVYASVRNYAFTDVKVRFFIKEMEDEPKVCNWDEMEPIKLYKPDLSEYHVCLQILDASGENVLQETEYTVRREKQMWEKSSFRTYLVIVTVEIFLFTIISIVIMFLYIIRKNELEKLQIELKQKVNEQTGELVQKQQTIEKLFIQTVTALSEAVDAKDRYTSGHSKRVAEYSRMIAARMGKSREEQDLIYRAGLLHDVGKIRIPNEIINKPGKLTDEEYNIMKIHPVTGYHILRGIAGSELIAIAAKFHHERYDGKGYPNGLIGDRIPEVARILGIADAYDAMTSNRSYRNALPQDVVRDEIVKGRGTQFDPEIADIMLQMIDEDTAYTLKQEELSHKKILAVDDDPMNNKIIMHIMKDEPMYEIIPAGSGKQALEILEKEKVDLILLDVKMPEMDGLETLRRIRKKYQTPVVLITGDKTLSMSTEFEELGCDDYVTKPFLPLLMKEVIHNMTERTNL